MKKLIKSMGIVLAVVASLNITSVFAYGKDEAKPAEAKEQAAEKKAEAIEKKAEASEKKAEAKAKKEDDNK